MRKSDLFLLFLALNLVLMVLMFGHASIRQGQLQANLAEEERLVNKLELTDLCFFTEANYTRHLSQADLHTPFQDSPMALEHFPSGALVVPPVMIGKTNGKMD